jgi:hypothetical protein
MRTAKIRSEQWDIFGVRQLAAAFKSLHIKRLCPKAQANLRTPNALSKFE